MAIKLTLENDASEIPQPIVKITAEFEDETRWQNIAEAFFSGLHTLGFRFDPQKVSEEIFELLSERYDQDEIPL